MIPKAAAQGEDEMAGFADILGHKKEVAYLEQAVRTGKISHAYIFDGEKGTGKRKLADAFAMTLQCTGEGDPPCGKCHSCIQAANGTHPDIICVQHERPSSIGVDEVREQVADDVQIRPYNGRYKIYIIPDAEIMTVSAQNALLKTIEEPPDYVIVLLLTANEEMLLETIRSRCVTLHLEPVPDELVKQYLMDLPGVSADQAEICAAFAQGNIGKAERLASSEDFGVIKESAMYLIRNAGRMDISAVIEYVKEVQEYRISIQDYLDVLALWYRDMVYYKATKDIDGIVFQDDILAIRETAEKCSYEGAQEVMKAIETAKCRLKANVNFDLTMELLFLTIKENIHD